MKETLSLFVHAYRKYCSDYNELKDTCEYYNMHMVMAGGYIHLMIYWLEPA